MKLDQIDKYINEQKEELKSNPFNADLLMNSIEQLERLKYKLQNNIQSADIKGILRKLGDLDLKKDPFKEATDLIRQLGHVPFMVKFLYPENQYQAADSLIRARPCSRNEARFTKVEDLSYKPASLNKSYQRATIPGKTALYGCLKKFNGIELQPDNRYVASLECLRMLSDISVEKQKKRVAYGKWAANSTINLISIINGKKFHHNEHIRKMYEASLEWSERLGAEDDAQLISDFFADRFADEEAGPGKEHLYMLSAIWADAIMSNPSIDGVLYPSVRSIGEGICVAIKPESCHKLSLVVAGESPVYKNKDKAVIDNEYACKVEPGNSSFEMKPVEMQYNMGEASCLKQIGVDSPTELHFE